MFAILWNVYVTAMEENSSKTNKAERDAQLSRDENEYSCIAQLNSNVHPTGSEELLLYSLELESKLKDIFKTEITLITIQSL